MGYCAHLFRAAPRQRIFKSLSLDSSSPSHYLRPQLALTLSSANNANGQLFATSF